LPERHFAVVVHGDAEGAENVRRSLSDWLCLENLRSADAGELDRLYRY